MSFCVGSLRPNEPRGDRSVSAPADIVFRRPGTAVGVESGPPGARSPQGAVRASRTSVKPPLLLFLLCCLCTLLSGYILVSRGLSGHAGFHGWGAVIGMLVGAVLMGLYRQVLNRRQSDGYFADWVVSSSRLGTNVSALGWMLGVANLLIFSIEISRSL